MATLRQGMWYTHTNSNPVIVARQKAYVPKAPTDKPKAKAPAPAQPLLTYAVTVPGSSKPLVLWTRDHPTRPPFSHANYFLLLSHLLSPSTTGPALISILPHLENTICSYLASPDSQNDEDKFDLLLNPDKQSVNWRLACKYEARLIQAEEVGVWTVERKTGEEKEMAKDALMKVSKARVEFLIWKKKLQVDWRRQQRDAEEKRKWREEDEPAARSDLDPEEALANRLRGC